MQKEMVIEIRNLIKDVDPTAKLIIICDNMIYFRERTDIIKWDDAKGVLIALKQNQDISTNVEDPIQFQIAEYDMIQFIETDVNDKGAVKLAEKLGFDDIEKIKRFTKRFTDVEQFL